MSLLKVKILISLSLFLSAIVVASNLVFAQSNDGIAIRIVPNPKHYSAQQWYEENVDEASQGSPSQLSVDGYMAIRDGRTAYVNVGNISGDVLYTNIYIMSYTQNATSETLDIFGQMLNNWTFNTNIVEVYGPSSCKRLMDNSEDGKLCYTDLDCGLNSGLYCDSAKAKLTRDVRRLADLRKIKDNLNNYFLANSDKYPELSAGTYVKNKSLSVWPSWQETLGNALSAALPTDPLNSLWSCRNDSDRDPAGDGTCWNETTKQFNNNETQIPEELGNIGQVYSYSAGGGGASYELCADSEAMGSIYTSIYDGGDASNNPACF